MGSRIVTDFGRSFSVLKPELALLRAFLSDDINAIVFGDR
jgi:hypothetical protein